MNNIDDAAGSDNIGAIHKGYFIPITDVVSVPQATNGIIVLPVQKADGKKWSSIAFREQAGQYTDEFVDNAHGGIFNFLAEYYIPKTSFDKTFLLQEMTRYRFLHVLFDMNGNCKLSGAPDGALTSGLHFKYKENVPNPVSGQNGYLISFYGQFCKASVGYFPYGDLPTESEMSITDNILGYVETANSSLIP